METKNCPNCGAEKSDHPTWFACGTGISTINCRTARCYEREIGQLKEQRDLYKLAAEKRSETIDAVIDEVEENLARD